MRLVIVSGMSGSGKSIALNTLEDLDYYCIDNLPVGMLRALTQQISGEWGGGREHFAVGVDARNSIDDLRHFPGLLRQLRGEAIDCPLVFLQADDATLIKRFSETRRRHPLTREKTALAEAIQLERQLLEPIASNADMVIDTTHTNIHQLRQLVRDRVVEKQPEQMSLLFLSFGYKHGIPLDADFVFDARCLPNPHWETNLRPLTGRDQPVAEYLTAYPQVGEMLADLETFLRRWLPRFEDENRSYLTVAVGCTGGQHRSVYLAEALGKAFMGDKADVQVQHRELS